MAITTKIEGPEAAPPPSKPMLAATAREEFEAWFLRTHVGVTLERSVVDLEAYAHAAAQFCYQSWMAARGLL